MAEENKIQRNLSLILPLGLLVVEVIVVVVLLGSGYQITEFLFVFLILMGLFLIYQISLQLWLGRQLKKAMTGLEKAELLIESEKPLEAIEQWKRVLLSLPKEKYLDVLVKMEQAYESQNMVAANQQVRLIQSKSIEFFEMTSVAKNLSPDDRRKWQAEAVELKEMIRTLPVEQGQDLSVEKSQE